MTTPPPGRLDTRRPFRAKRASAAGIGRRRLLSREFRRIIRGVYIDATVTPEPLHDALAVMLVTGDEAFVSHHTAALLLGGIVPASASLHASISHDQHRSRADGVIVHRSERRPMRFRGVRITSAVDTFLDMAAHLDLVDLVVLGDSLVTKGRTTTKELVAAASGVAQGGRHVRRAAALVREGVASAMETRLRLLVVLAGVDEPEVNIELRDAQGYVVRAIDMGYSQYKVGLEYDGRQHAESTRQYANDVRRREDLAAIGWKLWTAVSADLFVTPGETLERIVAFMRQAGMTVPDPTDEWRRHFPGRG